MQKPRIVVVGASAGGVQGLQALVASLPADLPAAVFVVLHVPAYRESVLPEILSSAGPLDAVHPEDGEPVRAGRIYVAPPDHHLLVEGDRVGVKRGPKENRFRPSVDALFRSAAYSHGPNVVGIVLSGVLDDGTSGLWTVKRLGGTTVVQTPDDARFGDMPLSALEHVDIDHTLPAAEMGALFARITNEKTPRAPKIAVDEHDRLDIEVAIAAGANAFQKGSMEIGELTALTCPECHGALARIEEGAAFRFRCHTGHAYTPSALLAAVTEAIDSTLTQALRVLEEGVLLLTLMKERDPDAAAAALFAKKAAELAERARGVQLAVLASTHFSGDTAADLTREA